VFAAIVLNQAVLSCIAIALPKDLHAQKIADVGIVETQRDAKNAY